MKKKYLSREELNEIVSENIGGRENAMRLGGHMWSQKYTKALDNTGIEYVKKSYLSFDDYDFSIVAAPTREGIIKICNILKELTKDDRMIEHCELEVPNL